MMNNVDNPSVNRQIESLSKTYSTSMKLIKKHDGHPFEMAKCLVYLKLKSTSEAIATNIGLPMLLVLQGQFAAAWIAKHFAARHWSGPKEYYCYQEYYYETEWGHDLNKYLVIMRKLMKFSKEELGMKRLQCIKEGVIAPSSLPRAPFIPGDMAYNNESLDAACTVLGRPWKYDARPSSRYERPGDDIDDYNVKAAGWLDAANLIGLSLRMELDEISFECLVRMQMAVSEGEPPRDLMQHPRHKHMAALTNTYQYIYHAHKSTVERERREYAWWAIYWLIEYHLRARGTDFHRDEFTLFCEIIARFQLMGQAHEEFMRHFQIISMFASDSHLRSLLERPYPMVPFAERGLPTVAQAKEMYDEKYG